MKLSLLAVSALLIFVGCSGSKSVQKVSDEAPQIELSSTEDLDGGDDFSGGSDEFLEGDDIGTGVGDQVAVENQENMAPSLDEDLSTNTPPEVVNESGEGVYNVQKNETLMMIAFKIYGDYSRWRELAARNSAILQNSQSLREGMTLTYAMPVEKFEWNPEGLPYLIKTGDTLSGISKEVYSTANKWRYIWDNNRPLIKDPNKIYAGFTIYYLENGREVANQ